MKKYIPILLFCLAASQTIFGQFTPQTLPFSQNWTNAALITADDDWSIVPGIQGRRGDALVAGDGANAQTALTANDPGVVDVNANELNPNTFMTGGVTEFAIANPVVALSGSGTSDAPYILISLNTTGQTNINVSYLLRDLDGSTDNAVQPVALQYRIGTTGDFTNVPAAFVADATTGPSLATATNNVNVTLPAAVDNQAEIQLRIITTNAAGDDEWVGIDDISVTGTPIVSGPVSFTALADCDNSSAGVGTAAAVDRIYVHISGLTNFASGDITFTTVNAFSATLSAAGTLGPINVTGLAGTAITLTATQGANTASVQIPVVVCGYPQNAQHCSPSVGLLAQNPPAAQNSGNAISSTNVYVLVRGGNVIAINRTGLFQGLNNLQAHTVHSFTVLNTDLATFEAQFKVDNAYAAPAAGCFANCWMTTITPNCCTVYTPFDFTNADPICVTPTGIIPTLAGSQTGVNYQLTRDGFGNVGSPVPGTGSAINFPAQTTAGLYKVVATASPLLSGCTSTEMADLTINPAPDFTLGRTGEPTCDVPTQTINFSAFPATGTYEFSFTTGGTGYNTGSTAPQDMPTVFADATASTTFVANAGGVVYWVRLRNKATGCFADMSVTTSASVTGCICTAPPSVNITETNVNVCGSLAATFNITSANGTPILTSTGTGTLSAISAGKFTYTPGAGETGTITITATIADPDGAGPCTLATDMATVTIGTNPTLTNQTPSVCSTNASAVDLDTYEVAIGIPASLPGGASVVWYVGDGTAGTNLGADPAPRTVANGDVFTVVYTNAGGCPGTAKVTFTVLNVNCGTFPWNGQ